MTKEAERKQQFLNDWKLEKKYNEAILKDDKVSESVKKIARERVKEADKWIKELSK